MTQINVTRRSLLTTGTAAAAAATIGSRAIARASEPLHEFSALPKLDEKQSGHLRHFRNTLALPDGDWGTMVSEDPMHAGDWTGFQYQLAGMAHAMGVTHQHRMPAAPGFFRQDMDRIVHKMIRPEVWMYWFSVSQGSPTWNPDQKQPLPSAWDPVSHENIFYSGHLNSVAALYGYLFNDAKYDRPDAFSFPNLLSGSFGPREIRYGLKSLNDVLYWQFVENGHLGVACQPNAVFIGCNQFPLWGLKWQDTRLGGSRADEAIASHIQAWKRFGGFQPGKETPFIWFRQQNKLARDDNGRFSVENGPVMPAGNWSVWILNGLMPEYAKSIFEFVAASSLARDRDGSLFVVEPSQTGRPGQRFARGADLLAGRSVAALTKKPGRNLGYAGSWGWVAQTLSERQDPRLEELLTYIDTNMNPTWDKGGLFYPVCYDTWVDGKFTGVTPTSGNVHFAYARLNVQDGLTKLVNSRWGAEHFAEPNLSDVSREVDVVRGIFLPDSQALVVTVRPQHGSRGAMAKFEFTNLQRQGQSWSLEMDGKAAARGTATDISATRLRSARLENGRLKIEAPIERETTLVLRFA